MESMHGDLVDSLPVAVFRCVVGEGATLAFTHLSARAADILGHSPEDLCRDSDLFVQGIHPRDRDKTLSRITEFTNLGSPGSVDFRFVAPGQPDRWVEWLGIPSETAGERVWEGTLRDITGYVRSLEEGRQREAQLRSMLDAAPFIMWVSNAFSMCTHVNQAWTDFTGYGVTEANDCWKKAVHPEDRERAVAEYRAARATLSPFRSEYRLRRVDGTYAWIVESGTPRFTEEGEFDGYVGVCVDISEQKKSEDAVRAVEERERLFRATVDACPLILWLADDAGHCTLANKAWSEFTGMDPTVAYEAWETLVHVEDMVAMRAGCLDAYKRLEPFTCEYRLRRHDGEYRWLLETAAPRFCGGTFIGYVGVCTDITEKKQLEESVRRSESEFRTMFEKNTAVMLLVDMEDKVFYDANQAAADFYGYPLDKLRGMPIGNINMLPPDEIAEIGRRTLSGESNKVQLPHRLASGEIRTVQAHPTPVQFGEKRLILCIIDDITDRLAAEDRLKESEQRFRTIWERNSSIMLLIDAQTLIIADANQAAADFYGYSVQDMRGMPFSNISLMPEDEESKVLEDVLDGTTTSAVARHRLASGQMRLVEGHPTPLSFGDRVLTLVIVEDITERLAAEKELRDSERFLSATLNAINAAVVVLDPAGVILAVNDYWREFWNENGMWMEDHGVGHSYYDVVFDGRPGEAPRREGIRSVLTGETDTFSMEYQCPFDINLRWFDMKVSRFTLSGMDYVLITNRDITPLKNATTALRESERSSRLAVEAANLTEWYYDVESDRCCYVQPPGEKPRAHASGSTLEQYLCTIHEDDRSRVREAMARCLEQDEPFEQRFRVKGTDGGWSWRYTLGRTVRDEDGAAKRLVGVSMDITDKMAIEERLRQAQKMEAVGRLAGGIAHDFNNLLTVILGHMDVAQEDLEPSHPAMKNLQSIGAAAQRASDLTRRLLTFARKQPADPVSVDLSSLVSRTYETLLRLLGENISVVWQPPVRSFSVCMDPVQFEQILLNLAVNARDSMPEGGILRVEISCGEPMSHEMEGEYGLLKVSDTGCGIPKDVLENIFEPFFTTKEVGKGTGLGLSICYGIVEQAGGHIEVESEVGIGTTVKVYLPLVSSGAPPLSKLNA